MDSEWSATIWPFRPSYSWWMHSRSVTMTPPSAQHEVPSNTKLLSSQVKLVSSGQLAAICCRSPTWKEARPGLKNMSHSCHSKSCSGSFGVQTLSCSNPFWYEGLRSASDFNWFWHWLLRTAEPCNTGECGAFLESSLCGCAPKSAEETCLFQGVLQDLTGIWDHLSPPTLPASHSNGHWSSTWRCYHLLGSIWRVLSFQSYLFEGFVIRIIINNNNNNINNDIVRECSKPMHAGFKTEEGLSPTERCFSVFSHWPVSSDRFNCARGRRLGLGTSALSTAKWARTQRWFQENSRVIGRKLLGS